MTAVHPTAFKQQVAKKRKEKEKKEEKFAKQKSTRYATLAGGLKCRVLQKYTIQLITDGSFEDTVLFIIRPSNTR
jgi:hypothetical protein